MQQMIKSAAKPMILEISGDTLTPVSIFQRISGTKKFLLESSLKHTNSGRFSFIGADPAFELITSGKENRLIARSGETDVLEGNPIDIIKSLMPESPPESFHFPFYGGAVGYAGYDIIRLFEDIGPIQEDELNMPDAHFMFYEVVIVFDHLEQKVFIAGVPLLETTSAATLAARLEERKRQLKNPSSEDEIPHFQLGSFIASVTKDEFIKKVKTVKDHISEGDIFQAVLSHRMKADFSGSTFSTYRKLRTHNPSPYMYYFEFGEYTVIGTSPESLVKVAGRTVYTNPIAGTRPRGKDIPSDTSLETELKQDTKELAEHRMLVDLGRNDLGKISSFGTVQVSKYLEIEKYRHVMHLVSELKGELEEGVSPLEALTACLPAGTVSGAPKVRAMEIINELEGKKRGLYSGAIGYVAANGDLDFALAIRTMIAKSGAAYIQAGAGIVHDSDPEAEHRETINKMMAFLGGLR